MENPIPAIDDVAFTGDKHIFSLREEHSLRFTRLIGKSEKLQKNRRRRWRRRRDVLRFRLIGRAWCYWRGDRLRRGRKNIPPIAAVFCIFAFLQQIKPER